MSHNFGQDLGRGSHRAARSFIIDWALVAAMLAIGIVLDFVPPGAREIKKVRPATAIH